LTQVLRRIFDAEVHDDVEIEDFVHVAGNDLLGAKVLVAYYVR
jgi:hypothetical protein